MSTTTQPDVTIYSTPTCGYCSQAKQFFADNDIEYTEYDVSQNTSRREEMVQKSGQRGVPVIIIGEDIIVGFDQQRINKALGANG